MRSLPGMNRPHWFNCSCVAVGYSIIALCFLRFASIQANASPVWPNSGFAAGILIVGSHRLWPGIFVGAFVANLITNLQSPLEISFALKALSAIGIAIGNTLEAYFVALLTARFSDGIRFLDRAFDLFRFILMAAFIPPLVSAMFGVSSLFLTGFVSAQQLTLISWTWYTGNVCGLLIVTPLLVAWYEWSTGSYNKNLWHWIEAAALLLSLLFVGQAICGIYFLDELAGFPKTYMVWPILLWSCFRFGPRGLTLCLIILATIAIAGTARGFQVFPASSENAALLYCQIFLAVTSVVSLSITAVLKEHENALEALEQAVAWRTKQLHQLIEEKQDLLIMTAHDLQTPVIGLRNLVEVLEQQPNIIASHSGQLVIAQMKASCRQLIDWGERILNIEEAEDLRSRMQPQRLDVAEILGQVADIFYATRDVRIELRLPDNPPKVFADNNCLKRVLDNLISNAIRHGAPDTLIVALLQEDGNYLRISIVNVGPTIPCDQIDKLFKKYARLRPRTYSGDDPSHGVGLYIVQRLVEAMDGRVSCASSKDTGTEFTVWLKSIH